MSVDVQYKHASSLASWLQVSAQVKQELQALFYGAEADGGTLPDSLLPWLAARFVNGSDLQASLAALEQSILGNVSRLVEQSEQKRQSVRAETLTQSIRHSTSQTGLSEEVSRFTRSSTRHQLQ